MQPFTAGALYGGGPAAQIGGQAGATKMVPGGAAVPSPDAGAAPVANTSPASVGDLLNDPTFWLVATLGAVVALAGASK